MEKIDKNHPLIVCRASAGTGKTFTLAAYYIAMLLSGESYRNILAVTFTNAATAEMKERIVTKLLGIARGGEQDFLQVVKQYMFRDAGVGDEVLRTRAEANLHAILLDYDNFSVTTIDSFLQQLIYGMAKAINRTADFSISVDADQVITTAVDTMLTSELTDDSKRTVYEYAEQCIDENKGWDIRQGLIRIANELYKESVQIYNTPLQESKRLDLDERRIKKYRNALYAQRQAAIERLRPLAEQAKRDLDAGEEYACLKDCKNAIDNIYKSLSDPDSIKKEDVFRGATDKGMATVMAYPQMRLLQQTCDEVRRIYWPTTLSLTYLNDMRLMKALDDSINKSLLRANAALLAQTAVTLAEALRPGDADFILEKAGIRYRHIMIDEFQDTSLLQWKVFLHLIEEIVAAPEQTVLIVGDTKQSIYRFRNGNWQIMEQLGKTTLHDAFNPNTEPLIRNQRSRERVVQFNLGVMQQIAGQDNLNIPVSSDDDRPLGPALYDEQQASRPLTDYYRTDKHPGGYVRCRFYPFYTKSAAKSGIGLMKETQQQALWDDVCSTIEQLLAAGEQPKDIVVLGRFNNEILQWASYCRQQGKRYPLLSSTQMVSRDSFQLDSSSSVWLLMEGLKYLHTGSRASAEFIRNHRGNEVMPRIEAIDKKAPLYDQLQSLLQILLCDAGYYTREDVAYINCLLDQVRDFIAANGSDVSALLQYWQDRMRGASISGDSSSNAIRLMSVHTAKGLEGKTVILLNAAWETTKDRQDDVLWAEAVHISGEGLPVIPVRQTANLKLAGEQSSYYRAYIQEHEAQLIDNYNLLYVALTRAADNLYVYALMDAKKHAVGYPTVGASLLDYTDLRQALLEITDDTPFAEYSIGDAPHINQQEDKRDNELFDYKDAESVEAKLYSGSGQICFRQSQESTRYMLDPEHAEEGTAQTDFGLLCHDIFAHIIRSEDAANVLDSYRQQGLIDDSTTYGRIDELIRRAFTMPQMQQWFDGSWQLMREAPIITPTDMLRPDRVMIKGDKAVVLDYKFAAERPVHIDQVRDYVTALSKMGYSDVEGWLWYAFPNKLVRCI